MHPRRNGRPRVALVVALATVVGTVVGTALTGCDLAVLRADPSGAPSTANPSQPASPVRPTPTLSSRPVTVDAACAADPGERAATVRADAVEVDPTGRFTTGGFSSAVADAGSHVAAVGAHTYRFTNFTSADGRLYGANVGPITKGLIGAGIGRTVVEMAPMSSTWASAIPKAFPDTNPLNVLRVTGDATVLSGFSLNGTPQGHLYNGLVVGKVRDLLATDIRVTGIPGDDDAPPGETFGINDFKTTGSRWSRIEVDGAGVGGAGFGANGSDDIRVCDTISHDNRHSMGFAFWTVHDIQLIDCTALRNGGAGFNFERTTGHVRLVRPVASHNRWDMRIASDQASATFTVVDPVLTDGHWTIALPRTYYGKPNLQRRLDVTLTVHGVSRPDLIRYVVP